MIKTLAQNFASQKWLFSRKKRQISVQEPIFARENPQEPGWIGNLRSILGVFRAGDHRNILVQIVLGKQLVLDNGPSAGFAGHPGHWKHQSNENTEPDSLCLKSLGNQEIVVWLGKVVANQRIEPDRIAGVAIRFRATQVDSKTCERNARFVG
jgi:hypothetical protein